MSEKIINQLKCTIPIVQLLAICIEKDYHYFISQEQVENIYSVNR